MVFDHLSNDQLNAHLQSQYSAKLVKTSNLDVNVYKIEFDSDICVARVFPGKDSYPSILALSHLLKHLESENFPAERLSYKHGPAVSQLGIPDKPGTMLLTEFVPGPHPERSKATFLKLGAMLGHLHSMQITNDMVAGGAWHHLSLTGGFGDECKAAIHLLEAQKSKQESDAEIKSINGLCDAIRQVQEITTLDLPKCLIHPDFVPVNIIQRADDASKWVVVDWAGAGIGLRIISLGFVLGVAAIRGKVGLVRVILRAYSTKVGLQPEEVNVIDKAAYARFLTILAWEVGVGRKSAEKAMQEMQTMVQLGETVKQSVTEYMSTLESQ